MDACIMNPRCKYGLKRCYFLSTFVLMYIAVIRIENCVEICDISLNALFSMRLKMNLCYFLCVESFRPVFSRKR